MHFTGKGLAQAVPSFFPNVSTCFRNLEVLQNFSRASRLFWYNSPKDAEETVNCLVESIFAVSFPRGSGMEFK